MAAKKKETVIDNSFGPNTFRRDDLGLLENVQYKFNQDGTIDWRSMVHKDKIYPNKDWFTRNNKEIPNSIDGLPDYQLVITLAGLKELANLRGFVKVRYRSLESTPEFSSTVCRITWIPNFETGMQKVVYEDMASAHIGNVDDFGQKYLDTIAANRSFARCVRNFLNIHVVSSDEIGKSNSKVASKAASSEADTLSPQAMLKSVFETKFEDHSWEDFKSELRKLWKDGTFQSSAIKGWKKFSDISAKDARVLLGIFSKK
jgi:hypothetical protein